MSTPSIAEILADPSAHGFRFNTEPVSKGKMQLPGAQIAIVEDVAKFAATFGETAILASLDGSSIRVETQGVNRNALWANHGEKREKLQEMVVAKLLGAKRTRTTTRVVEVERFLDVDGNVHDTKEAAREASLAILAQ